MTENNQQPEAVDDDNLDAELIAALEQELEADNVDEPVEAEAAGEPEAEPEPEPEPGDEQSAAGEESDEPEPEAAEPDEGEQAQPDDAKAEEAGDVEEPEVPKELQKPSDEFGELDKGANEKTKERFQTLKDRYDDLASERDQIRSEANEWVSAIRDTGTNPEQFGQALTYLRAVNSGRPEDLQVAYDFMQQELNALSKLMGKVAPGADPLAEHTDLKQRVDDGFLSEADAMELAGARAQQAAMQAQQQKFSEQQQEQTRQQAGIDQVTALGKQLRDTDPNFNAKLPYLKPIIDTVASSGAPPEKWAATVKAAYDNIPVQAAPPPPPPKPTVPNPVRPGETTGNAPSLQKEPGSAAEAIDMALSRGF